MKDKIPLRFKNASGESILSGVIIETDRNGIVHGISALNIE